MLAVFLPRGEDVNSGGVDVAVAQDIGKLGQVLVDGIEAAGKQMAEIVREYLSRRHSGRRADRFHHFPNIASV